MNKVDRMEILLETKSDHLRDGPKSALKLSVLYEWMNSTISNGIIRRMKEIEDIGAGLDM